MSNIIVTGISVLGVDLGQSVFHLWGIDAGGHKVFGKRLSRSQFMEFLGALSPTLVAMEACRGSHHWARCALELGHQVRLIHPKYVKPFVKTNKNDWADAEAICVAVGQPGMRFVPVKSLEQQSLQMLHGARSQAVRARTAKANQIRAWLHEAGVVIPRGVGQLRGRVPEVLSAQAERWPALLVSVVRGLYEEFCHLDQRIADYDAQVQSQVADDPRCQQLMSLPGVGPLSASALVAKIGGGEGFRSARHFAAWLGLVPRHEGTGGRNRLYGISKRGDAYARSLLIHGARSALRTAAKRADGTARWVEEVAQRRGFNVACVALANKTARMAYALLRDGTSYQPRPMVA